MNALAVVMERSEPSALCPLDLTDPWEKDVFAPVARTRVAAQRQSNGLLAARDLVEAGLMSLDSLLDHPRDAQHADRAYRTGISDSHCLTKTLDWRNCP